MRSCCGGAVAKRRTASAADAGSPGGRSVGRSRCGSQRFTSFSQFLHSEAGHTMSALRIVPARSLAAVGPVLSRVKRSVSAERLLPKPIECARMQPLSPAERRPETQSHRNCTASRWCGRSARAS